MKRGGWGGQVHDSESPPRGLEKVKRVCVSLIDLSVVSKHRGSRASRTPKWRHVHTHTVSSNVRNFPRKQLSYKQQFSPSLKMKINFKWSHQGSAFKIGDVIDQPPLQERKVCPGKPKKSVFDESWIYKEKFPVRVDFFFFLTWKKNKNKTKVFLLVIRH